jgi:hypothetical protein
MKTTIDMAREVYGAHTEWNDSQLERLEQLVALVRADERERAMRENAYVLAEREACAKVCFGFEGADPLGVSLDCAAAIRARSKP